MATRYWRHKVTTQHSVSLKKYKNKKKHNQPISSLENRQAKKRNCPPEQGGVSPELGRAGSVGDSLFLLCISSLSSTVCMLHYIKVGGWWQKKSQTITSSSSSRCGWSQTESVQTQLCTLVCVSNKNSNHTHSSKYYERHIIVNVYIRLINIKE